ncbi:MAG: proteasome lid subunit RPN8/RPN11 [Myxococcota bacterium]|jgi:proteasome lid subunit RPN8/RPN11
MSSLKTRDVHSSGTTLILPAAELARLHDHAIAGFPNEVVGIMAGSRSEGRVSRVVPLYNERTTDSAKRYRVSGLVVMKAEMALDAEGLEVLGYYHSHPDHPAMYSDTDRDLALPNMSYLITAVHSHDDGPRIIDTKIWRLREDRSEMDLETLTVDTPTTRE